MRTPLAQWLATRLPAALQPLVPLLLVLAYTAAMLLIIIALSLEAPQLRYIDLR